MKESDFLKIIKDRLSDSSLIGDDCAYLDDFDLFISQDTLVENVHFSLYTTTPYLLGRKSVSVNLSDLAAALAVPKFITVSLSLPPDISSDFVSELYRGINDVCCQYGVKVAGGDITGSSSVVISVTAIGKRHSLFFSSRKYAKKDDLIVVTGDFGKSAAGLYALSEFLYCGENIISCHLNPVPRVAQADKIANLIDCDIAATDVSDGLADSLYKIASESRHSLKIDFDKVPVSPDVIDFARRNDIDYKNFVKWGGEDYELLFCISENIYSKLNPNEFVCIGRVQNKDNFPSVIIKDGNKEEKITKEVFEANSFNHFA